MRRALVLVLVLLLALLGSTAGGFLAQSASRRATADAPPPAGYVPLRPGRIFDSRGDAGTAARLAGGTTVTVATGLAGAAAVVVNIALTQTAGPGFVTVWPSGPRPLTAVINATTADENISNSTIIPVAPDGTFLLYTLEPTHIVVDLQGWFPGSSTLVPAGLTAVITGYGPSYSLTEVSGTVTNGGAVAKDARADVHCPDGTVATDDVFAVAPGATKGFSALCNGLFTSGATVTVVEI